MKKWIKRTVVAVLVLGAIGTAFAWYVQRGDGGNTSFRIARLTRGDLLVTIDATGTLEPERTRLSRWCR